MKTSSNDIHVLGHHYSYQAKRSFGWCETSCGKAGNEGVRAEHKRWLVKGNPEKTLAASKQVNETRKERLIKKKLTKRETISSKEAAGKEMEIINKEREQ